jgi:hypothetical protein
MAVRNKRKWSEMTRAERAGVLVLATVQLSLAAAAWRDLAKRPADQVNGPKPAWALAISVNFVGPITYFAIGRRKTADPAEPD